MTIDDLLVALTALGEHAVARNRIIDLAVYGGSSLMLVSNFRLSSADVDAVAQTDQAFIDQAARAVAIACGLADDWLNDGVRTYLSPEVDYPEHHVFMRSFPSESRPGIRIYVPTPEYLLAMKLMSLRIGPDDNKDLQDILNLCQITRVLEGDDLISLASAFYPEARISGKLRLSAKKISQMAETLPHDAPPRYLDRSGRGPDERS